MTTVEEEPVDGRAARAMRTRAAIVDACIGLVDEGDLKPTTPRIADRAGVSVRSVFQHFDSLETLFAAVADRVVQRVAELIVPIDPDLPLAERIDIYVRQRALILEVITPIRRASAVHGPFSEEITTRVRQGHDFLRQQTGVVFGPEIDPLTKADREEFLDILDTILGWASWDNLRSMNGRSVEQASRVVVRMLTGVFADLESGPR